MILKKAKWFIVLCIILVIIQVSPILANAQGQSTRVTLSNGWSLTPAGVSISLSSDLPLNMAISPDHQFTVVTNNGNGKHTLDVINVREQKLVQSVNANCLWLGLCFEKKRPFLYASGGNSNLIIRYVLEGQTLSAKDTLKLGISWPNEKIGPAGLTFNEKNRALYVVTKENNRLYECDFDKKKIIHSIQLSAKAYTCIVNPVRNELYISAWGGGKIWIYNTLSHRIRDSVSTGDHPTDMTISRNGKWLFVANANSNSVSVINTVKKKVAETLNAALYPNAPIGSTTNSLALCPDSKTLYIANADNNCLAVFDVSDPGHSHSIGFIPTGWYPTCVKVLGKSILVLNGKGISRVHNLAKHSGVYEKLYADSVLQTKGQVVPGTLAIIPVPGETLLHRYSRQVYLNTPYSKQKEFDPGIEGNNPVPATKDDPTPIKYIFYVLKENRTYDQVLGDMPKGNGDSSLCLFGQKVTPNAHALADEFVLFDNFYVNAEVSADGHNWSMAAYATDYVEKNWPSNYSGRGGTYDFDGGVPAANPTKGFIWNYCGRAGVPFRNYGEFMDNGYSSLPILKKASNYCSKYPGWNLGITDVYREKIFEKDFDSLVAIHAVRTFNTVYLPNDHTWGTAKGSPTPMAYVADNDLALGRLIDHISHSPIWNQTAIFVVEDDAHDGPDHVDARRTEAFVISPYVRKHIVDHTMYSTSSMLRTIELILGLPPMSQYDAAATPMWRCFWSRPDITPFKAHEALVNLNARSRSDSQGAIRSSGFNFSKPDNVPEDQLNEIIWKSVKGEQSSIPTPIRSAFVQVHKQDDND